MTTVDLAGLRRRLESERDRLLETIHLREQEVAQGADRQATDAYGYSNHLADGGTQTFEVERDLALEQNARQMLEEVHRALERMNAGTYGKCERCGNEIQPERLDVLPHATLCVRCRSAVEHGAPRF